MPKQILYNSAEQIAGSDAKDPYLGPAFSLRNRLKRVVWTVCWALLYRISPRPLHAWRVMLLRMFGAKMGRNCHFYPGARIWAPWNLVCADKVTAGEGAEIYNPAPMYFGANAIVSQGAYLCGATHDCDDPAFPLHAYSTSVGAYAWVCARAVVSPGVNLGEGAVLGLASVATRDLEPWTIYAGVPAVRVRERKRSGSLTATELPVEIKERDAAGH